MRVSDLDDLGAWVNDAPFTSEATRVDLHRVSDNVSIIKETSELHLTASVGGRHEGRTRVGNRNGLSSSEFRTRVRVVDQVCSRGTTAETATISIDNVVASRPKDRARLLNNALAVLEMTWVLHDDQLSVVWQNG